jgi:hypothetical protein
LLYHTKIETETETITRIRSVPLPLPKGAAMPEWLLQLAANIAGKTVNDREESVSVPRSSLSLESVRRELASLPSDAPYVEWGRWMLDDRADRPIAPGFTITPAEAEELAERAP